MERIHPERQTLVDFSKLEMSEAEVSERENRLRETDLAPYELAPNKNSRALFWNRIETRNNRLLRNAPELKPQVNEALLADDNDSLFELAADLDIARQLYSPEGEKPINTILSFLNLCEKLRALQIELEDTKHASTRLKVVTELLCRYTIYGISEELIDDALVTIDRAKSIVEESFLLPDYIVDEKSCARQLVHLTTLYEVAGMHSNAHRYVDQLPMDTGETPKPQDVKEDSRYVAELFGDIQSSREFGIKMGYKSQDEIGGSLIFSPPSYIADFSSPQELKSLYHPAFDITDMVAQVIHAQKRNHEQLKIQRIDNDSLRTTFGLDVGLATSVYLGPDGELYTWRDCKASLRDIALKKGRYTAYRKLQATILSDYFDITHRLEDVIAIQKELHQKPTTSTTQTNPTLETIERLVVPRVRYVAKQQAEGPITETSDRPLKLHGVTWHRRKLPEGWRASPKALELARELGVTLAANETLVRSHERGSRELGRVAMHQFVKRSNPGT